MKEKLFITLITCLFSFSIFAQDNELVPPTDLNYDIGADYVELYWSGQTSVVDSSINLDWGIPVNFQNIDNDGDGEYWQEISAEGFLGTGATVSYMAQSGNPSDVDNWLITIPYAITEESHLILHLKSLTNGIDQDFQVLANSEGMEIDDFNDVIYDGTISSDEFLRVDISLSNYGETDLFFAFRHTASANAGIVLDEIWLTNLQENEEEFRDDILYGYNIYKDDVLIGFNTAQLFFDFEPFIGTSEYYVTAIYNNGESLPSESVLVEYGTVVDSDESFENAVIPEYWRVIDNGVFPFWKASYGEANSGSYSVSISAYGEQDDWLITPQLSPTEMNHSISFYAKTGVFEPNSGILDIWVSTQGNDIEDFTDLIDEINFVDSDWIEYSYSLVDYIGQNIFIGFQFLGNEMATIYMDDISYPAIVTPSNSISISDIDFEPYMQLNQNNEISFFIYNKGSYPLDGYTVQLKDYHSGEELVTYQGGFIIPGMNEYVTLNYYPTEVGIKTIYAETSVDNDPYRFDDYSQPHQIYIQDEATSIVSIGNDSEVELGLPFNILWPYNLTQTIYPSYLLTGFEANQTEISGLSYYYANEYSPEPLEISVWVGETSESNLDAGWIDYNSFTHVFTGDIEMITNMYNESIMSIEFDQPYSYRGNNLVIMVYREDTSIHIGDNNLLCSSSNENTSLIFFSDDVDPDPQNPPQTGIYFSLSQKYPNISLIYSSDSTSNDGETVSPLKSTISKNYPNPFNPSTNICFSLAKPAHVSIEIYNLKGQLVNTLVNCNLTCGNHNVVWNGDDRKGKLVSSGIYFAKLKTDGNTKSLRKMMLMK